MEEVREINTYILFYGTADGNIRRVVETKEEVKKLYTKEVTNSRRYIVGDCIIANGVLLTPDKKEKWKSFWDN